MIKKKVEAEVETIPVEKAKKEYAYPIEIVPSSRIDPFNLRSANPAYTYRWCAKNKMAANRRGIWRTVLKDKTDFENVQVEIDHSPEQNFFSYGDLILCCARKETTKAKRKALQDRNEMMLKKHEQGTQEVMDRISKEGIRSISKGTLAMMDENLDKEE